MENFIYNENENTYTCPQGHTLTTNGTWHRSKSGSIFQQFKTRVCKGCPVREQCTKSEKNGEIIQRRQFAENIEANRKRIEEIPETYKKRQAIVEHPFGTIKRQWGFSYILKKSICIYPESSFMCDCFLYKNVLKKGIRKFHFHLLVK